MDGPKTIHEFCDRIILRDFTSKYRKPLYGMCVVKIANKKHPISMNNPLYRNYFKPEKNY